jgi:hypothetical protein
MKTATITVGLRGEDVSALNLSEPLQGCCVAVLVQGEIFACCGQARTLDSYFRQDIQ